MASNPITINFVALGCAKNLVDSEKMLGLLLEHGMVLVGPDDQADVMIINTCGFIDDARKEALAHIDQAISLKHKGIVSYIVVAGCLAQHWASRLQEMRPDIDMVVGLTRRAGIAKIVERLVGRKTNDNTVLVEPCRGEPPDDTARLRLTDRCWSYLRISEGCSQGCSFCTIPAIRGPFRSKKPEIILAEAKELIADGCVEINLIGQETTGFGCDLGYEFGLADLIRELNKIEGLRWLRVLYAHPALLGDEHIEAISQCEKVVPYLDLPLQHINDRVLDLMNRHIDRCGTEQIIKKLRERVEGLTLRTTMMVGFPSETEDDFTELLDFVREYRFEALGCFAYCQEEGTAAARMADNIDQATKQDRHERLMLTQQEIAFAHADKMISQKIECLIVSPADQHDYNTLEPASAAHMGKGKHLLRARHRGQAPEIDSHCLLYADETEGVVAGNIVTAEILNRTDYDLLGVVIPYGAINTSSSDSGISLP